LRFAKVEKVGWDGGHKFAQGTLDQKRRSHCSEPKLRGREREKSEEGTSREQHFQELAQQESGILIKKQRHKQLVGKRLWRVKNTPAKIT